MNFAGPLKHIPQCIKPEFSSGEIEILKADFAIDSLKTRNLVQRQIKCLQFDPRFISLLSSGVVASQEPREVVLPTCQRVALQAQVLQWMSHQEGDEGVGAGDLVEP